MQGQATTTPALTFGVAGHVDHGKTALVRALTGVETDRLAEEQRRGISIELGFAPLALEVEAGAPIAAAMVDMPGHERFVRRMIAGAVGIDAVVLVVAADDGVMPQAREHLAICELLGVEDGVVVLTKVDLLGEGDERAELLELLELDIAALTEGTFLAERAPLRFSAKSAADHIDPLRAALAACAQGVLARRATQRGRARPFRMPVDRAFHLRGRGTVVTGTVAAGRVQVGDALRAAPGEASFRVRGLERHGVAVDAFDAPGRLAINLAGATTDELPAGTVLAAEDGVVVCARLDAWLQVLPSCPAPIERRARWIVHVGTARVEAAIVPLGAPSLAPGEAGPVQVHLDEPLAVAAGERFVLRGSHRDPRFGRTVAGGRVLLADAPRHRLDDAAVVADLEVVAGADDEAALCAVVRLHGQRGVPTAELVRGVDLPPDRVERLLAKLAGGGALRKVGQPPRWLAPAALEAVEAALEVGLAELHVAAPERAAIEVATLARHATPWLDVELAAAVVALLVKRGAVVVVEQGVARSGHVARRAEARRQVLEALRAALARHGRTPPKVDALLAEVGAVTEAAMGAGQGADDAELALAVDALLAAGQADRLGADTIIARDVLVAMADAVVEHFADSEAFSTGELKDLLGVTRKHLIPLAEWLDAQRLTVRDASGSRRIRARALELYRSSGSWR